MEEPPQALDAMSDSKENNYSAAEHGEAVEGETAVVEEDEGFHTVTADEDESNVAEKTTKQDKPQTNMKTKQGSKPPSSRAPTHMDKKTQQMLAEFYRLKNQMREFQQSIQRPPVRPFSPDIFNSLSPYYNCYMVNTTIQDLQQEVINDRGYGPRPTALGVVDPEISWKLDNFPNPAPQSRLPGRLFHPTKWSRNLSQPNNEGSTRLPPLPMPNFPKFNQSNYQPHKMTYDHLADFRSDLYSTSEALAERQAKVDYERTKQDWNRMNLSELKKLPPSPRYHFKKTIESYLGTSRGSSRALKPLTKELDAASREIVLQH